MAEHISALRKDRSAQTIGRKIEVLEAYLSDGVPAGATVPKTMTNFRLWENPALGLAKIGSPNTMDKLHNRGLKARAIELMKEISKRSRRKVSKAGEIERVRREIREKDRLLQDMINQYHTIKVERDLARQGERRWQNRAEEAQREIAELRKKLNLVVGLRPVHTPRGAK